MRDSEPEERLAEGRASSHGHGSIETTGNVYMMEIPDSVAQMVAIDVTDVMGSVQ